MELRLSLSSPHPERLHDDSAQLHCQAEMSNFEAKLRHPMTNASTE
jgi:hypothetical protein